jgi:AcrR family transcriptional regulator
MIQGKRQLQKETTREKIIQTAMRLYLENGISTTTDSVAREAGLSHGAVFVHFSTSEDLQIHVLERFTQEIGDKMHNLSVIGGDLQSLLLAHLSILEEYEHFYTDLILNISTLPEDVGNMLISLQSILSFHFSLAIERARLEGTMKNIPLHMMFNTWLGLVHYYLLNACFFAPGESVLKRYEKELVDNFMVLISK